MKNGENNNKSIFRLLINGLVSLFKGVGYIIFSLFRIISSLLIEIFSSLKTLIKRKTVEKNKQKLKKN